MSALEKQVGGDHYSKMKIQPIEFITANELQYREANVIKYVCRHTNKNGKQDIQKAMQYLEMILEDYEVAEKRALVTDKPHPANDNDPDSTKAVDWLNPFESPIDAAHRRALEMRRKHIFTYPPRDSAAMEGEHIVVHGNDYEYRDGSWEKL